MKCGNYAGNLGCLIQLTLCRPKKSIRVDTKALTVSKSRVFWNTDSEKSADQRNILANPLVATGKRL